MADKKKEYESFTDLKTWQEAHALAATLNSELETSTAPTVVTGIQREAMEVTHSIARGFYKRSFEEKIGIYYHVLDCLVSVEDKLLLVQSLGVVGEETYGELSEHLVTVRKMTFSLIKKLKEFVEKSEKE